MNPATSSRTNGHNMALLMYFSYTTLSTTGFGDFNPRSDLERLLCIMILLCWLICIWLCDCLNLKNLELRYSFIYLNNCRKPLLPNISSVTATNNAMLLRQRQTNSNHTRLLLYISSYLRHTLLNIRETFFISKIIYQNGHE